MCLLLHMSLSIDLRDGGLLSYLVDASDIDCVRSRREGLLVARPNPVRRARFCICSFEE